MNKKLSVLLLLLATTLAGCAEDCSAPIQQSVVHIAEAKLLKNTGVLYDQDDASKTMATYDFIENTNAPLLANRLLISMPLDLADSNRVSNNTKENRTNPAILPVYLVLFAVNSVVNPEDDISCKYPTRLFEQSLSGLEVTSDSNISSEHLAGSNLTDLFRLVRSITAFQPSEPAAEQSRHIASFYTYHPLQIPIASSAVNDRVYLPKTLGLYFDSGVEVLEESVHTFTITLSFENGDVFTIKTDPITLM